MGTLVWSPLAGGLLTGRYRKTQQADTHRSRFGFQHLKDDRRLDAVEQLIPLTDQAGLPLTHLAIAFDHCAVGLSVDQTQTVRCSGNKVSTWAWRAR